MAQLIRERRGPSGLSWLEAGDPKGPAVVYFHGTAKAREPLPFPESADRLGFRLLMADRPGYGSSAPNAHASLSDIGRMVLGDLADEGLDLFSVLGWSGGGPHALACAAVAPSRVRSVGLIASWAPMDPPAPGLPLGVRFGMRAAALLPRPAIRLLFMLGGQSSAGMVDDVRRVARPWGFGVGRVAASVPVLAWHAEGDHQVPLAPWQNVDGIDLTVVSGNSHDVVPEVWEAALRRIAIDDLPPMS